MDERPELIAFGQNKIGGVQSFYYNLLDHDRLNYFRKRLILTDDLHSKDARRLKPYLGCEELIFTYGNESSESAYNELGRLISNDAGVLLVNFPIELEAISRYRCPNKAVIFICHDESYLKQALKYEFIIDAYIAHNPYFAKELKRVLPVSRGLDVHYLPYGIALPSQKRKGITGHHPLRVLFVARLVKKKGIYDLSAIDDYLVSGGVRVDWTIIGDGPERESLIESLKDKANFKFRTPETSQEIFDIASEHDLYILPSYLDGLPVALLEAMSVGLVPIVSNFNPGVHEVVKSDIGFVAVMGDIHDFGDRIIYLNSNREELERRSLRAIEKVRNDYEVSRRTEEYYKLFLQYRSLIKPQRERPRRGRLDRPFIPPLVKRILRSLRGMVK